MEEIEAPATVKKRVLSIELEKSAVAGETWYVVCAKWLKGVKEFIGMIPADGPTSQPGPIDNRLILSYPFKDLKKGLADSVDYEVVSSECWNLMAGWYGVMPDQPPIARKAIVAKNNCSVVEVYLMELICLKNFADGSAIKISVSRVDLISFVNEKLRKIYKIPSDVESRLWVSNGKLDLLEMDVTVQDSGLRDGQTVVLDTLDNGTRKYDRKRTAESSSPYSRPSTSRNGSPSIDSLRPGRSASPSSSIPGVCGLTNLGSTCYMNSVIQCLSNSPPLTEYFLNNYHLEELNIFSEIKGEIAKEYGNVIHALWSGLHSSLSPIQLKIEVGKINEEFREGQNDAQELLTFLLAALHQDLNRIKENKDREDYTIGEEPWEDHLKRNNSIVVNTFHGLLMSRIDCSQCQHSSVTFQPFCPLSLPLPLQINKNRFLTIRFIPYDPSNPERLYGVEVPRRGLIKDLCAEVASKTQTDPNLLIPVEVHNSHFHKKLSMDESLESIDDTDLIFIYEMTEQILESDYLIIPVCFWELCQPNDIFSPNNLFGVPFLIILPKNDLSLSQIVNAITYHMRRNFNLPDNMGDINVEPHSLNIFILESGNYNRSPIKLHFDEYGRCTNYMTALMHTNEPERIFERKILIVQLTSEERRERFSEQLPDYDTDLDVSSSRGEENLSIYECLDLYTANEVLDGQNAWLCPKCIGQQSATKKIGLWKLPKVLILHLSRFEFEEVLDKIDTMVEYPINKLDLSQYVINPDQQKISYDLIGVINHYGTPTGGHYVAYCKNKVNKTWYSFNDSDVDHIKVNELMSQQAYLLFYIQNDSVSPPDTPTDMN